MAEWHGRRRGPGSVAAIGGALLVCVGGLALLQSVGVLPGLRWWMLWPTLVVVAGVALVVAALLPRRSASTSASIPRDGADAVSVSLAFGGGTLALTRGDAALVAVESRHDDLRVNVRREGTRVSARIARDFPGWAALSGPGEWHVRVAGDVALGLELSGGAGRFDLDCSELQVAWARLSVGAADVRVRLPVPTGEVAVRLEAGAVAIVLVPPPGAAYRVRREGLLTASGRLESPDYEGASDRLTIDVTGGVASVTVA